MRRRDGRRRVTRRRRVSFRRPHLPRRHSASVLAEPPPSSFPFPGARGEKERVKTSGKRKTVSLTPRHQRNCMRGNKQNCKARSRRSRITFPQVSSLTPIFLIASRSVLPFSLLLRKLLPCAPPLSYFRGFRNRGTRVYV